MSVTSTDQNGPNPGTTLVDRLLANEISIAELGLLRGSIDADDLSVIIQRIYDLNEDYILKLAMVEGRLARWNRQKNIRRNKAFTRQIRQGFRKTGDRTRQVVLAEGDSWFNYPKILHDVIDGIRTDKDLAVLSIASGGDWLLNMLSGRQYVEQLSILHPDWFLISAGGNDLVGARRLATMVKPEGDSKEFEKNAWAQELWSNARKTAAWYDELRFRRGLKYLSKDFFALLMFFHLQYYYMINGIVCGGNKDPKFPNTRIITQGYDFPVPSYAKHFGWNIGLWYIPLIRMFFGHGCWLKTPLQIRGITDQNAQEDILYSMLFLFNEMMIDVGSIINYNSPMKVFHIDSRGAVGRDGWADELHPKSTVFKKIADVFLECISEKRRPDYGNVFLVAKPGLSS